MSGHSPEPWKFSIDVDGRVNIFVDDGRVVTLCHARLRPEDARRIVACVNACAGIPTDMLENADSSAGLFGRIAAKACTERDRATAQRDQLLAALKFVLPSLVSMSEDDEFGCAEEIGARAAIAACERTAAPSVPL